MSVRWSIAPALLLAAAAGCAREAAAPDRVRALARPGAAVSPAEARAAADWQDELPDPRAGPSSVFWLRVDLAPRPAGTGAVEVAFSPDWQQVELFDGRDVPAAVTGRTLPLAQRPEWDARLLFRVPVRAGAPQTLWLRFTLDPGRWNAADRFVARIEPLLEAERRDRLSRHVYGLYGGLLLTVVAFCALFFLVLRDRAFLDYLLYAAAFGSIWLARAGAGAEMFWPHAPERDQWLMLVTMCAALVLGNRFATGFLELRARAPRLRRLLQALSWLAALAVALSLLGRWRAVEDLLAAGALVTSLAYLGIGAALLRELRRPSRFFLAGSGLMAAGMVVYMLRYYRLLPDGPLVDNAAQIGSALEMLVLALGVGDRLRSAAQDQRAAEARQREELEREVEARTHELAAANQRLELLSLTDPLTSLANRRRFDAVLKSEWRRAARAGSPLAILAVDVDWFKAFNDRYGHQAGDECLRRVARALAEGCRRAGDIVARTGGEEFVVVAPGQTLEAALAHADKLRREVEELQIPHQDSQASRFVTVCVGVAATVPAAATEGSDELLAAADAALYRAKHAGRNRVGQ